MPRLIKMRKLKLNKPAEIHLYNNDEDDDNNNSNNSAS